MQKLHLVLTTMNSKNCQRAKQMNKDDVRDPFGFLAEELGVHVFSFLSFKDVLVAAAVSKHWQILAEGDLGVWVFFNYFEEYIVDILPIVP